MANQEILIANLIEKELVSVELVENVISVNLVEKEVSPINVELGEDPIEVNLTQKEILEVTLTTIDVLPSQIIKAGDGLSKVDGNLSVNVDGAGIEIASDALQIKDGGVTFNKLECIKDEDDMVSDSDIHLATQQSIKAYIDAQVDRFELNIMLNAFRIAINGSLSQLNMVDGVVDEFEDETGIDTVNSLNEDYDSTNDLYKPLSVEAFALDFGEIDDFVSIADHPDFTFNAFSIEVWAKPDSTDGAGRYVAQYDAINQDGYFLSQTGAGDGFWSSTIWVGGVSVICNSDDAPSGDWQHLIITRYANGNIILYVDGVAQADTKTLKGVINSSGVVHIGDDGYGNWFAGNIDLARWYNKALSPAEVTTLYNSASGVTGGDPLGDSSCIASYLFDTGFGSTAVDSSGNGHNGTIYGSPSWITGYVAPSRENMTLISKSKTAEAQPSNARIVIFEEDMDVITINTDLKTYISRDGGSTWAEVTLSDEGDYENNKRILTGTVDLTQLGIGSGTNMKWKITTYNEKDLKLHGVGLLWD